MLGTNCCVCCENPAALGCFDCELLTNAAAPLSGVYTLRGQFKGVLYELKKSALMGELLTFDISPLNENFLHTAEILDPNGVVINVDGAPCFTFSKVPKF